MVLNESMASVKLLEFRQQTSGDVAWALQISKQITDTLLPALDVSSVSGWENYICWSKASVVLN